jgi:hypothetical protein
MPLVLLACLSHAPPGDDGSQSDADTDTDSDSDTDTDTDSDSDTALPACGPDDCAGCCAADGTCQTGTEDLACGARGESCGDCAGVELACEAAVCVNHAVAANGLLDDSTLHLRDDADVARVRQDLIDAIWKARGFPSTVLPTAVTKGVASPVADLDHLASVDQLDIAVDFGCTATAWRFYPTKPNGGLVVYHQGHSTTLGENGGDTAIDWLLDNGYTVIGLLMPLYGTNTGPYASHDELMAAESDEAETDPLSVFLQPVAVALNDTLARATYEPPAMIGISGGGWTTVVYAAIDPRIVRSYPVAGSLPLYLREAALGDVGDSEQYWPSFYSIAGYLDLYAMAADSNERGQIQILNRYDSCCFSGVRYEDYAAGLSASVASAFGGDWSVFLDETHSSHLITKHQVNVAVSHDLWADGIQMVDDLDPPWGSYATTGEWTTWTGQGFGSELQQAALGDKGSVATWTFDVADGDYEVAATWVPHPNRASDATYAVNGSEVAVDQRNQPASYEADGTAWQILAGAVKVTDQRIEVSLSGAADGYVIADGVRVTPVP